MDPVTRSQASGAPVEAVCPPPDEATLRWVEQCLGPGSKVKMVRPLTGGTRHANHALLVESRSGHPHRLVLRRWTLPDQTAGQEFSPEREIAALALLAGCRLPTPELVAADPAGAYCDAPALLVTRLIGHPPNPGTEELSEYLIQMSAALLGVHSLSGAATMPPYLPYNRLRERVPPAHATRPELWEQAFELAARPAPEARPHFIHRDYQPDNTLWSYGRLTGVVDWSSASYGPIGVDIAQMRCSLALRYGLSAADAFLDSFDRVSGGYVHDPYWDLRSVLDLLAQPDERHLGRACIPLLEAHLAGSLARLGVAV
ncbi:phosphotransferase family protein [Thermomonospora curvata]|uniref:Aminoglycoside phosphotransferase n=1 Tax=Thermomonospora curvata (strain ATCC 19995 / DSM 43183 / JCM 3096 / KCTC 9072 / NBRC 15933 / NCIMB 10081 / Henssen B9) TaxID=471852 RepID=D1A317_THECD|nr:aminoglycoside phosphotransferase [Thermomonospora curvata DSM 43183]PKK12793.1 MAG: aminoglycoside phosphotransferase family protein [Thermomonospora sp. CIF 1]